MKPRPFAVDAGDLAERADPIGFFESGFVDVPLVDPKNGFRLPQGDDFVVFAGGARSVLAAHVLVRFEPWGDDVERVRVFGVLGERPFDVGRELVSDVEGQLIVPFEVSDASIHTGRHFAYVVE